MFEADFSKSLRRWHVLRLRNGSKAEAVLLSQAFFSLTTHWVGRTVPCSIEDCDLCELVPGRGLHYIATHVNGEIFMVELGGQSAAHLEQHVKLLHGGMKPGLVLELSRRGEKLPVRSEVVRFKENVTPISALNLAAHALALYRFPVPNPTEDLDRYSRRCCAIAIGRNRQLALEMKAGKRQRA